MLNVYYRNIRHILEGFVTHKHEIHEYDTRIDSYLLLSDQ